MRGVQSHDTGGTRLSFQSDTCLRDRCLSALVPVTSSSRPCFPIDTPPVIMVALYKPHDTVQPLSSSDKQAHPCRGRASSLRHLSNLFHGTRSFKKKKARCLEGLRGTSISCENFKNSSIFPPCH